MNSFTRLHEESNKIGTEFILTELDTAFTFLAVAETTSSAESRERNRRNALEAYNIALRMREKVVMDPRQKSEFQDKIADLKKRLEEAGFKVS
jgi:hypothetical protein